MDCEGAETVRVLERSDPAKQESLISENEVDPMDAEQTWPTKEELQDAKEEQKVIISVLFLLLVVLFSR